MEPGRQPKPSGWHISQLLGSKVISQALLHFLGLEWTKKTQSSTSEWSRGKAAKSHGGGGGRSLLHYSCSWPKSSMATPCSFCTLQIRKRLCHLCPLTEKKTNVKKNTCYRSTFPVPWPKVISFKWPWDQNWQSQPGSPHEALQQICTNFTICVECSVADKEKKFTEKYVIF